MINKYNNKISKDEWENRINLAACYHLADHFGFSDIIWNLIVLTLRITEKALLFVSFNLFNVILTLAFIIYFVNISCGCCRFFCCRFLFYSWHFILLYTTLCKVYLFRGVHFSHACSIS